MLYAPDTTFLSYSKDLNKIKMLKRELFYDAVLQSGLVLKDCGCKN